MRARVIAVLVFAALAVPGTAAAQGRCGAHPWCDTGKSPEERANLLLAQLTQDEKVGLLGGDEVTGVLGGTHTHTGTQTGVPRLDIPTVLYSDGPVGPRQGQSTGLPIPLALAATFDTRLAGAHGDIAANEAKAKGNDVIFGPTVNIARVPLWGRTFETYGEDPFLTSRLAVSWIEAAQAQGVIADVKHFAANNQEGIDPTGLTNRPSVPLGVSLLGERLVSNSIVDERTMREIYLPQFEAAVKEAHSGTVMCSYNRLGGVFACENGGLLQKLLRDEWGFNGYVLADYGASHNTAASLTNGLDFEPWPPIGYQAPLIDAALATGGASTADLDQHVRAMLTTWFRFGLFDRSAYRDDDAQIDKAAHAATSQHIEEQAITLLRNRDGTLPLDASKLRSIAVFGQAAMRFVTGGGSGNITPFKFSTPLDAIRARAGKQVKVSYDAGADTEAAAAAAKDADVAVVVASDYYTEGADRSCLRLRCPDVSGDQDGLIRAVAAANPRTVVVLESGGPDLTPWRPRVGALLEAWYPGGQGGTAIARVLFGDVDPGGRLPMTFPDDQSQLPTAGDPASYPGVGAGLDVSYNEGVLVGYRWYDYQRLEPAFPFGFGLSYTSFRMRRLKIRPAADGAGAKVAVTVTNAGRRAGTAVPQLYLGLPAPGPGVVEPPAQLKGFRKLSLRRGQSRRITFTVDRRALSYWDVSLHGWKLDAGCTAVMLGWSSRDFALRGRLRVGGGRCYALTRTARRLTTRPPRRTTSS